MSKHNCPNDKLISSVLCHLHMEPFRSSAPRGVSEFIKTSNLILCRHTPVWVVDCKYSQEKYDELLAQKPLCCRLADYGLLIPVYDMVNVAVGGDLWVAGKCSICKRIQPATFPVNVASPGLIQELGPTKGHVDLVCFLCYLGYRERVSFDERDKHPYQPSTN